MTRSPVAVGVSNTKGTIYVGQAWKKVLGRQIEFSQSRSPTTMNKKKEKVDQQTFVPSPMIHYPGLALLLPGGPGNGLFPAMRPLPSRPR